MDNFVVEHINVIGFSYDENNHCSRCGTGGGDLNVNVGADIAGRHVAVSVYHVAR